MRLLKAFLKFIIYFGIAALIVACRDNRKTQTIIHTPNNNTILSLLSTVTPPPTVTMAEGITSNPNINSTDTRLWSEPALTVSPSLAISSTPTPEFFPYMPKENSLFRFGFIYPSQWEMDESSNFTEKPEWHSINLEDISEPNNLIILTVEKQGASLNDEQFERIISISEIGGKILDDKNINVDGQEARWFLVELPKEYSPDAVPPRDERIEIHVFMVVGEDGYWFRLTTGVDSKDSQFVKDFQTMILGMKYIP